MLLVLLAVFSANSHATDRRRASARQAPTLPETPLYDDFDGHGAYRQVDDSHLAVDGELSADLWYGQAEVIRADTSIPEADSRRNILRLELTGQGQEGKSVYLLNPETISDFDVGIFSADILVPSSADSGEFAASLAVPVEISDFQGPGDPYWAVNIGVYRRADGYLELNWGWYDKVEQRHVGGHLVASHDVWYNLAMDVRRLSDTSIRVRFYVDGRLVAAGTPADSAILADPSRLAWGPTREIWIWRPGGDGPSAILVDNVRADFRRLSFSEVAPSHAMQGERVQVTIRGDDLSKAVIPYSTTWGVSFVDIQYLDRHTLQATAIVDDLAPAGSREIRLAVAGIMDDHHVTQFYEESNSLSFTIAENPGLPESPLAYGAFEDYDDPARDGYYDAGIYDPATQRGSGKNRLVYTSEAHPETFPEFNQAEGHLEVWTAYDPIGYWDSVRFAEPEGFYEKPRNMLRIGCSVSVTYLIPSESADWRLIGPSFGGWYQKEDGDRVRWRFEWTLSSNDEQGEYLEYVLYTFSGILPWTAEIYGFVDWPDFRFDESFTLRYDVVVPDQTTFFFDLFADGQLKARLYPENTDFLLNVANWGNFEDVDWGGPIRGLKTGRPQSEEGLLYLIDRIDGVYPLIHPVLNARANLRAEGGVRVVFDSNPVNDYHLFLENPGLENGHIECHHKLRYEIYDTSGEVPQLLSKLVQSEASPQTLSFIHEEGQPNSQYSIVTSFVKGWQSEPVRLSVQ